MLSVEGKHNGSQVFCDVVLMSIESLAGMPVGVGNARSKKLIGMRALIDTGATHTCITSRAALKLDLDPLGFVPTTGIHGTSKVPYYLFRIGFISSKSNDEDIAPNNLAIMDEAVRGTELQAHVDFDILLGMDVISCGNLFVWQNRRYRFEFDDAGTPTY